MICTVMRVVSRCNGRAESRRGAPDFKRILEGEISPSSSAADCRVAGCGPPRPAPFYEQEVVKAFHDLTHESLARSHRAASVKKRRSGVKGRRSLSAATLDAAKAR